MNSDLKTCGTCKYLGKEVEAFDYEKDETCKTGFFLCSRIMHDKRWKYHKGDKAVVEDGSGYHAALCVESDFGCNLWEAK